MGLARVFTNIGSLIIRKPGDDGGPPADRVSQELDNIIAWAKNAPRCIHRDFATVNSSGVGPDVLHTFSLAANSLATNGDYLTVWYSGNTTANDTDKAVQAQFDNQTYQSMGVADIDSAIGWVVAVRVMRRTATEVIISHTMNFNIIQVDSGGTATSLATGARMDGKNVVFTVANLNSNAITMRVRSVVGAGAAAADVFQNLSIIELCQQ